MFETFENKVLGPNGTVRSPRHYIWIYRCFVFFADMNHISYTDTQLLASFLLQRFIWSGKEHSLAPGRRYEAW